MVIKANKKKKNYQVTHVRKFLRPRKSEKFIIPKERESRLAAFIASNICDCLKHLLLLESWIKHYYHLLEEQVFGQPIKVIGKEACNDERAVPRLPSLPNGKLETTMAILREIHFVWRLGKMIPRYQKTYCEFEKFSDAKTRPFTSQI